MGVFSAVCTANHLHGKYEEEDDIFTHTQACHKTSPALPTTPYLILLSAVSRRLTGALQEVAALSDTILTLRTELIRAECGAARLQAKLEGAGLSVEGTGGGAPLLLQQHKPQQQLLGAGAPSSAISRRPMYNDGLDEEEEEEVGGATATQPGATAAGSDSIDSAMAVEGINGYNDAPFAAPAPPAAAMRRNNSGSAMWGTTGALPQPPALSAFQPQQPQPLRRGGGGGPSLAPGHPPHPHSHHQQQIAAHRNTSSSIDFAVGGGGGVQQQQASLDAGSLPASSSSLASLAHGSISNTSGGGRVLGALPVNVTSGTGGGGAPQLSMAMGKARQQQQLAQPPQQPPAQQQRW